MYSSGDSLLFIKDVNLISDSDIGVTEVWKSGIGRKRGLIISPDVKVLLHMHSLLDHYGVFLAVSEELGAVPHPALVDGAADVIFPLMIKVKHRSFKSEAMHRLVVGGSSRDWLFI